MLTLTLPEQQQSQAPFTERESGKWIEIAPRTHEPPVRGDSPSSVGCNKEAAAPAAVRAQRPVGYHGNESTA